jgi:hypothetical protein
MNNEKLYANYAQRFTLTYLDESDYHCVLVEAYLGALDDCYEYVKQPWIEEAKRLVKYIRKQHLKNAECEDE